MAKKKLKPEEANRRIQEIIERLDSYPSLSKALLEIMEVKSVVPWRGKKKFGVEDKSISGADVTDFIFNGCKRPGSRQSFGVTLKTACEKLQLSPEVTEALLQEERAREEVLSACGNTRALFGILERCGIERENFAGAVALDEEKKRIVREEGYAEFNDADIRRIVEAMQTLTGLSYNRETLRNDAQSILMQAERPDHRLRHGRVSQNGAAAQTGGKQGLL